VRQLVLASYRCGHQAAALDAFAACRLVLGERGLVPGPDLRAVELGVLRHEAWVAAPPPPAPDSAPAPASAPTLVSAVLAAVLLPSDRPVLDYPCPAEVELTMAATGGRVIRSSVESQVGLFSDVEAALAWARSLRAAVSRARIGLWVVAPGAQQRLDDAVEAVAEVAQKAGPGQVVVAGDR